jgi:hypothetical protein
MRIFSGVAAKTSRAIEHLETLQAELRRFRERPSPYFFVTTADPEQGNFVFRLHPSWDPDGTARWTAIVGETVHNLRSALDHMIWECVRLSGSQPGTHTAFPLCRTEPEAGFAAWATAAPTSKRRAGKLHGLSEEAVLLVEQFQPYRETVAGTLLAQIDSLWQIDKHRMPLPLLLLSAEPTLEVTECVLLERLERQEEGVLVIEARVSPTGPDPQVDIKADAPFDLAFDGRLVIDDLLNATVLVVQMRGPFENLFPDEEDLKLREQRVAFETSLRNSKAPEKGHGPSGVK